MIELIQFSRASFFARNNFSQSSRSQLGFFIHLPLPFLHLKHRHDKYIIITRCLPPSFSRTNAQFFSFLANCAKRAFLGVAPPVSVMRKKSWQLGGEMGRGQVCKKKIAVWCWVVSMATAERILNLYAFVIVLSSFSLSWVAVHQWSQGFFYKNPTGNKQTSRKPVASVRE